MKSAVNLETLGNLSCLKSNRKAFNTLADSIVDRKLRKRNQIMPKAINKT